MAGSDTGGAPHRFNENRREAYLLLLRQGVRRYAAARAVGVTPQTVRKHRNLDPEFEEECLDAEREAIEEIEDALYETAKKGNVTAQQIILYNRDPDRWKDQRRPEKIEVSGRVEIEAGPALERIAELQRKVEERRALNEGTIIDVEEVE